tara:strand:+ start:17411 stop:18715 length:1305 start_codon:yes stop_codon:yes gene_type:complete
VNNIILKANIAQKSWSLTKIHHRTDLINELKGVLADHSKEYSKLIATEMGKPISQGMAEIEKCIKLCNYYIDNAESILADKNIPCDNSTKFISYKPIGLILGIMPWNYPFWQVFRFSIPIIISGNGVLLKHAPNVQGCARSIQNSFCKAGFPNSLFSNLILPSFRVKNIIKHQKVAAVTFTGSSETGREVASIAGSSLKKTVLELGGNDPYIILDDAEISKAVNACINSRLLNAGQSCIAAKRIIVTKTNEARFTKQLLKTLDNKIVGDPTDQVDVGPLASIDARNKLHQKVLMSVKSGANLVLGGKINDSKSCYYPITVLTNVKPGMVAFEDELFGPVFSITTASSEDEAISLANNTKYGLGASLFTSNLDKGRYIVKEKLNFGTCYLNDFVKSDPRMPFGGIKDSGYGRELSVFGVMEFVNVKSVVIENNLG